MAELPNRHPGDTVALAPTADRSEIKCPAENAASVVAHIRMLLGDAAILSRQNTAYCQSAIEMVQSETVDNFVAVRIPQLQQSSTAFNKLRPSYWNVSS